MRQFESSSVIVHFCLWNFYLGESLQDFTFTCMIVKVTLVKCWYMAFVLAYLLDWEGKRNVAAQNSRQDTPERNFLFVPSCFTDCTWL